PADRFGTAGQFADALRNPALIQSRAAAGAPTRRDRLAVTLGALALAAGVLAAWGWLRPGPAAVVSRYALSFSSDQSPLGMMQLSRDGSLLAYGGRDEQSVDRGRAAIMAQLWVKRRDRADPSPVPGTTGASVFTISPDAQSLAFVSSIGPGVPGQLRRIPVNGGPFTTLADSAVPFGLAWLDDGKIIYSKYATGGGFELWSVSEDGGPARKVWYADSTGALALPSPLPNGRGVVVARYRSNGAPSLWVVDARSGNAKKVIDGALSAQYVSSGHLIYARGDGALLALPFNPRSLEVTGSATPVMEGIEISFGLLPQYAVSLDGTLIARTGSIGGINQYQAIWVDRAGRSMVIDTAWNVTPLTTANNVGWSLSPDGSRLAIALHNNGNDDIWVKQLPTGPLTRITFDTTSDVRPRWSPDGKSLTYISSRAGFLQQLLQKNADGTGRDTLLLAHSKPVLEGVWSPDGSWLLARVGDETTESSGRRDIVGRRRGTDTVLVPLVADHFNEAAIALSPDGKWLAYESTEAGSPEVFVRPFPDTESGKWQVSTNGGFAPLWSREGRELFFVNSRREMIAVTVAPGPSLQLGERKILFTLPNDVYGGGPENYTPYDVARDGRFLMMRLRQGDSLSVRVLVVENFTEELKARARQR
ncbi:MAG TPA: hypothetical protein VFD64_18585, partial [Gemmatimonadaceae bacterium]|nr:hypothetical protein [Gemmatimonadaceae bacterium]